MDGDQIADFLHTASLSQTREFITYLQKGSTSEARLNLGALENPNNYPSFAFPPNVDDLNNVLGAVANVFMNKVRQKSLDAAGVYVDSNKINSYINNNKDKIKLLLGETRDGENSLKMLASATKINLKKLEPVSTENLNVLRNFIGKFGISPESFIGKQYALHQNRISKVFVAVETATRTIFKLSDAVSAAEARQALHNWDDFARGFAAKQKSIKDAEDTLNGDIAIDMQEISKSLKQTAKSSFFKLSKKARNKILKESISATNRLRPMILTELDRGEEGLLDDESREVAFTIAGLLDSIEVDNTPEEETEENVFKDIPTRNKRSMPTTDQILQGIPSMSAGGAQATLPPSVNHPAPTPSAEAELGVPDEQDAQIFREANKIQLHRNKQKALGEQDVTKSATLNPETGALTWQSQ